MQVGSGKSSMLNSILGEMRLLRGSISCHGSIAYVPQVFVDNIYFFLRFQLIASFMNEAHSFSLILIY